MFAHLQSITSVLFYFFSAVIVISSFLAVTSKKSVHSVLLLVLTFFAAAWVFIIQRADFLAMLLIIIYVGAIAVLFLFVVMMLEEPKAAVKHIKRDKVNFMFSFITGIILFFEIFAVIFTTKIYETIESAAKVFTIKDIGDVLYTEYFIEFQIMGFLFFTAMVGAIVLTFRKEDITGKRQNIFTQISRESKVVLMKPEVGKGVKI